MAKAVPNTHLPREFRFKVPLRTEGTEEVVDLQIDTYNYIMNPPPGARRGWYASIVGQEAVTLGRRSQARIAYGPFPTEDAAIEAAKSVFAKTFEQVEEVGPDGEIVISRDKIIAPA
jgi:hypothetical protein